MNEFKISRKKISIEEFVNSFSSDSAKAVESEQLISQKTVPYPRTSKDYASSCTRFKGMSEVNFNDPAFHKIFAFKAVQQVNEPRYGCVRQLNELEPIRLKDMLVNKRHIGKFLLCRVLPNPYLMPAMHFLVQDEDGEVEDLAIYNYLSRYEIDADKVYPENTVIAIKEPFLKIVKDDKVKNSIYVTSPTDVVVLDDHSVEKWKRPISRSFDELNDDGNRSYVAKDYQQAIRYYTQALKLNENSSKIYANRAAAHLELEMFYAAFQDAQKSAQIEPSEKVYFRMARACYEMRQFDDAVVYLRKCLELNSSNRRAKDELKRSEQRVRETLTGEYDFKLLVEDVKAKKLRLDVADFVSRDIRIADVMNGKGVLANRGIKRGELLIASKAASIFFDSETKCAQMTMNVYTKELDKSSRIHNVASLLHKVQHDPYLAKKVYELYPGSDFNRNQEIPEGIVDPDRVQQIVHYNESESEDAKKLDTNSEVSISKRYNMLGITNSGLWIVPSYLNHSCVPNTTRLYLGDFVVYYAFRDIEKDEEITTRYTRCNASYSERQKTCNLYGFVCKCVLCKVERSDPNYAQRESLVTEFREKKINGNCANAVNLDLKTLMEYEIKIKRMYEPEQVYQTHMGSPWSALLYYYRKKQDFSRSAEISMHLYELHKFMDNIFAFKMLILAYIDYLNSRNKEAVTIREMIMDYLIGSIDVYSYGYDLDLNSILTLIKRVRL